MGSELAKLTANAFSLQELFEQFYWCYLRGYWGDVREVSRAIGSDQRIGSDS